MIKNLKIIGQDKRFSLGGNNKFKLVGEHIVPEEEEGYSEIHIDNANLEVGKVYFFEYYSWMFGTVYSFTFIYRDDGVSFSNHFYAEDVFYLENMNDSIYISTYEEFNHEDKIRLYEIGGIE